MKPDPEARPSEIISVKVPASLALAIRRRARQDDRTLSGYLRRLLADAIARRNEAEDSDLPHGDLLQGDGQR